MRAARIFCPCLLALTAMLSAQTAAPAPPPASPPAGNQALPTDPAALLQLAAQVNGLHGADLHPWHMRATWQTLDEKKHVKSQGTWEEWWASEKKYRIVTSSARSQATIYGTDHGAFIATTVEDSPDTEALSTTPDTLPFSDFAAMPGDVDETGFLLQRLLTHPVPEVMAAELAHMRLQESRQPEGATALVCALQAFILPGGAAHMAYEMDSQFHPTIHRYCFDDSAPILRLESTPGGITLFNSLVRFQDHYLPRAIRMLHTGIQIHTWNDPTLSQTKRSYAPVEEADVSLDVVEPLTATNDTDFIVPAKAIALPELRGTALTEGVVAGDRIAGSLASYPVEAREWHIQGAVLIGATIQKDGSLADVHVISGPRALQQSTLDSVKAWRYEPFLVGAQPVNVITRVKMTYSH